MDRTKRSMTPVVYQIKVTLKESKPPIWRRIQVTSATTLAQLHQIVQCVMGWEGYHLYRFEVGGMEYGDPRMLEEMEGEDARRVALETLVQGEKAKFLYEYDFGDSWDHELRIEKVLPYEAGKRYPVCLTGKRACPPEDCGGIWGYASFLDTIQDPQHPEHEEMLEWVGGEFDPEAFDLDEVNRALQHLTESEVKRRPR
jgi:Plasmid pRiA4b ORF-3-like protein